MSHLFCFGLGYSARAVAEQLTSNGWSVSGTSTTPDGVRTLARFGFGGYCFNGRERAADVASALEHTTHVLLSVPPDAEGDPVLRHHSSDLAASQTLAWIGYFSTVGVYGDAGGRWVDEGTEPNPSSERGKRRLAAERAWLDFGARTGKCVIVFRLPGIYGPGRNAIDDLRAGTARRIVKPGQVFNRVHVDDISATVIAAIRSSHSGQIYNVTDDEPGPPQDVVTYAARLLGLDPPPVLDFDTAPLSDMARSFYGESKRVSNRRMKSELGVRLIHPSYREGLETLLRNKR